MSVNPDVDVMLSKLAEKMADGREDQVKEVQAMQRIFKDADLKKNLGAHPAMQKLLAMLAKREGSYSTLLANKKDATQAERTEWFARRTEVRFILSFFESADKTIDTIRQKLEYQLSDDIGEGGDNQEGGGGGE